ncbi:serine/threonine-protein kinase-like protein [Tuber borchii]|uniref:Serine/threonine-protein kinase-like protein n=1 Tax=Tuber borchii TaxID=42251 RepID=A0A2T6ZPL0_TUBBO|nr:serine/threonine-protein kinase-like protein [Tuber borchii]
MEVCEQAEMFIEEDRCFAFYYTKIILREGNQYYYAITSRRYPVTSKVDLDALDIVSIPPSQIWPSFPTQFRRAPEPLPQDCFVKRPSLLEYGNTEDSNHLSSLLLNEAEVCEILRASPHPNIAQYLGCIVEDDKIMGLCFIKYGMNLEERVTKDSRPFDAGLILLGIQEGIRHLHSLGLIHCDINPTNIVMDGDTPIIVDFDSCRRKGEKLGTMKVETPDWTREDFEFAMPENDEYGLSKIRDFLLQVHKM